MRGVVGLSVIEDKEGSRVVFCSGNSSSSDGGDAVAHAPQPSLRTYVPAAKGGADTGGKESARPERVWDRRGKKADHPAKARRPK